MQSSGQFSVQLNKHRVSTEFSLAPGSNQPPTDLVAYDSGYTLAEFDGLLADWSDEDAAAFHDLINSERLRGYLRDTLDRILLATGQREPTFVDAVLYHPSTRELFERIDDD